MSNTSDKPKSSRIVQELCQKLKIQLDQLGVVVEPKPEDDEQAVRRNDLFKALQEQLAELS